MCLNSGYFSFVSTTLKLNKELPILSIELI